MTDQQLLLDFVTSQSQPAFRQLVERHTPWLYSACLRRLRDPALAEDATQAVFLALAQKAPALLHEPTLSPWLHQVAKYVAANILRANARRARHESEAAAMTPLSSPPAEWKDIEADLEPALDRLPFADRQMLLLRFYEHKSHPEIAALLHISEAAAAKRLERALTRLRTHLAPAPTTPSANLSTAALASLLHTHTVLPLPATLAASTATASATTTTLAKGALLAMATAKLQTALIWGGVIAACLFITIPATVITLRHRTPPITAVTPIAAPADPPPTSAPQVSAFAQIYALAPGELVKHITDAPAEIRDPFIREHFNSSQASRATLFIGWIGNDMAGYGFFGARRYSLSALAEQILSLESLEVEGNLANRTITGGDFSFSPDAPPDQLRAALQKILQDDFQLPVSLQFRDVPRKVIVLRGKWKFTPNPDVPATNSPTGPFGLPIPCVDIYGGDPFDKDSTLTASGSGPSRALASNLADWIHQQVIIEATGFPPLFGYRCHSPRANDPDALAHDRDSVLKHITDQTALTWSEETRTVHRLFIENAP